MKTRRKYRPRNVNMDPKRLNNGTFIYAGDSLYTVPCPNCIVKGMRQNLRQAARRSQVAFPRRRKNAKEIMAESKIPTHRKARI